MDKILTVEDVAQILRVKPITVREMFRQKRLRAFKVGKAWRTTEAMLDEDLAALARGEKPLKLPEAAAGPKRSPKKRPAKKSPKAAPRKKAAPSLEENPNDDTQQFLF